MISVEIKREETPLGASVLRVKVGSHEYACGPMTIGQMTDLMILQGELDVVGREDETPQQTVSRVGRAGMLERFVALALSPESGSPAMTVETARQVGGKEAVEILGHFFDCNGEQFSATPLFALAMAGKVPGSEAKPNGS